MLTASVESVFTDAWNCSACLSARGTTIQTRKQKGCFGLPGFRYSIDSVRFMTCPGNLTTPQVSYLMEMSNQYDERGILPEGNNFNECTYKFFEIFNVIRAVKQRHLNKQEKKAKMKQRQKRR